MREACSASKRGRLCGASVEREVVLGTCYSYRQFCSLGPLPPRTPARPDPQVPRDHKLGPCVHGKIGSFYFMKRAFIDVAAFAFLKLKLSFRRIPPAKAAMDYYALAVGY